MNAAADSQSNLPPEPASPFSTLNLPLRLPIDQAALRRAWLTRTAALHPDRADEPEAAAQALARVNAARDVLSTPHTAAAALIATLAPPEIAEHKEMPEGFAMEMLDLREELEAVIAARDEAGARALVDNARRAIDAATDRVSELLQADPPSDPDLRAARMHLNTTAAYERIIDTLTNAGLI